MLDDPEATNKLIALMKDQLPLQFMILPSLAEALKEQEPTLQVPRTAEVIEVEYFHDAGGIMCRMNLTTSDEAERSFVISISHLKIDGRHPLARRIATYQKRRIKKVMQERNLMAFARAQGLLNTRPNT